jgi:hypothetical protein
MRARRLVWLLLIGSLAGCQGKRKQAPPATGSGTATEATGGSAMAAAAGVIGDAGIADAVTAADADPGDAAGDAAVDAAPQTIVLGNTVPDFGCLGWSPQRQVAACIIGSRGVNIGGSQVDLVFIGASADVETPPSITILQSDDQGGMAPDEMPPALIAQLASAVRGFVPWDRSLARITSTREDDKLVMSAPISVGGMRITVRTRKELPAGFATQFSAMLTVRVPGGAEHVVAETSGSLSSVEVRGFAIQDRAGHRGVIVEQIHGIGDEGIYGSFAQLWRCTRDGCDQAQ